MLQESETSLYYRGWRVVILCFTLAFFSSGLAYYGQSIYLAELQQLHGWTSFTVSTASTASFFFSAILGIFVGDTIAKFGPKRFLLIGVGCFGTALMLIGKIKFTWQLYPTYLLMSVGWASMNLVAISTIVARWFNSKRGLALSLSLNGASFGGVVCVPILLLAIQHLGLETALLSVIVIMFAIIIPMIFIWGEYPPQSQEVFRATNTTPFSGENQWTRKGLLNSYLFWNISIPFALNLFVQVGILVHLLAILEPLIGKAYAGLAISIISASAVIGRLGLGLVIDRLNVRLVSAISFGSQAATLLLLYNSNEVFIVLSACALFGLSVGNVITLPTLIIQHEYDKSIFPMVVGLSAAVGQITYALGPSLIGLVKDISSDYSMAIILCTVINVVAAVVILIRPKNVPWTSVSESII